MNALKTMVGCGLVSAALFASAEESVYKSWSDWGFHPVERVDEKSGDNCRYYSDVSEPVHGPWLTNPTETGITVTWTTRTVCGAGVEWREKGTEAFTRRWITCQGAIDYLSKIHTLHLTGLKPGTTYEYRLVAQMAVGDFYGIMPFTSSEIHSFTTRDASAASCKVFLSSDIHGSFRLTLDPMLKRGHAKDAEMIFLLGDNVEDGMYNDPEYWTTFCFLDECSYRFAKDRPLVAIRGNHDCSGRTAVRWADYLPRPDGRAYYTVRQGPVLFVLLDCFAEWKKSPAGSEQFTAYQKEMADWLRNLKTTKEWTTATYRVVLCHYGVVTDFSVAWPRKVFGEILHDTSPAGRVHLFMCGHEHRHRRKDPGAVGFENLRLDGRPVKPQPPKIDKKTKKPVPQKVYTNDYPFVELELDTSDAVTLEATKEKLSIRAWDWRTPGKDVKCYDAIDIAPDGKVATPASAK